MSLKRCLEKLGVGAHEAAILKGSVKDYLGEGQGAKEAALLAVEDAITGLQKQRASVLEQAEKAGIKVAETVDQAALMAAPRTSAAQQESGVYRKGHWQVGPEGATMGISIENAAGDRRQPDWPALVDHYGYILDTVGFDKDHLDVFIKPGTPASWAGPMYVVNQTREGADDESRNVGNRGRKIRDFDEHKVMLGFDSWEEAGEAYVANYEPGWDYFDDVIAMSWEGHRKWATDKGKLGPKGGALTPGVAAVFDAEVGNGVPQAGRANPDQGRAAAQRDLLAAVPVSGEGEVRAPRVVVEVEQQGKIKLPKSRIVGAVEAALAFRQLTKNPREKFHMIGVDIRGQPIAYYDLFSGTVTQTSVYPREVWTALYQTPGVRGVWFGHNHPSGVARPSQADELLTSNLRELIQPGDQIEYKGHVILAGLQAWSLEDRRAFDVPQAEGDEMSVPVYERRIKSEKHDQISESLNGTNVARAYFRNAGFTKPGVLLLDAQHRVAGWWEPDMSKFTGASAGSMRQHIADVLRLIGRHNPAAAIAYAPHGTMKLEELQRVVRNLKAVFSLADVKMLDAFLQDEPGNTAMLSLAERHMMEQRADYHAESLMNDDLKGAFSLADTLSLMRRARRGRASEAAWVHGDDLLVNAPMQSLTQLKGILNPRILALAKSIDLKNAEYKEIWQNPKHDPAKLKALGREINALRDEFEPLMRFHVPQMKEGYRFTDENVQPFQLRRGAGIDLGPHAQHVESLLERFDALEKKVDAAYERGDPKAEELDAQLAVLKDQVTGMGEAMLEDEDDGTGGEASLERDLAMHYAQWLKASPTDKFGRDEKPERAMIVEFARQTISDAVGAPISAADSVVLDAMKDAYVSTADRRERIKGAYQIDAPAPGMHPRGVEWELKGSALARAMGAKLRIVGSALDLPAHAVAKLLQIGGLRVARGYTDMTTGEVYLVAGNLQPGQPEVSLLHEAVGHAGVLNVLGEEGFNATMREIYGSRQAEIRREATAGFLSPYKLDLRNPTHQVLAAMEYVAHKAEAGEEQTLWQRLVAALRAALRRLGFVRQWSEGDLLQLLRLSRESFQSANEDTFNGMPAWQLGEPGPLWYSGLARAVEKLDTNRAPASQWMATIAARPGVKKDELEWTGLPEWLGMKADEMVERDEILAYLRDNGVQLEDKVRGEPTDLPQPMQDWERISVELDAEGFEILTDAGHFAGVHDRQTGLNYWVSRSERDFYAMARAAPEGWASTAGLPRYQDEVHDEASQRPLDDLKEHPQPIYALAKSLDQLSDVTRDFRRTATKDMHLGQFGARHGNWQLPGGGKNYRNILITLPGPQQFQRDTHWSEWNVVAFARTNERKDADGKRVLFVEEIQSDWAESGRKYGLRHEASEFEAFVRWLKGARDWARPNTDADVERFARSAYDKRSSYYAEFKGSKAAKEVIAAPFVGKTPLWTALVLKRLIRYAADHGYERVAWTTGDQQNERYALEKNLVGIAYTTNGAIYIKRRGVSTWQKEPLARGIKPEQLAEHVGEDLARALLASEEKSFIGNGNLRARTVEGAGMKLGGEAMREFYDKIVVNVANDVLKKLGGGRVVGVRFEPGLAQPNEKALRAAERLGDSAAIGNAFGRAEATQPGFDVTEAMKASAALGMPMFQLRERPGLSEVYGVREGKLLGMARRAYGQGAWSVYLANGTNETLFERGQFRTGQAATINEVQRIFNREGLELRVMRPQNIPVPDKAIFDGDWVAPRADSWLRRAVIYFQNRLLLPELYEKTIAREVGPIPDSARAHREARLAHPRAAGKIADFEHAYVEPIVEIMKTAGLTLREVGQYLYARHAPERNAAIEEINPDNKTGSGLSNERAQAILDSFGQAGKLAALEPIGAMADRVNYFREEVMIDKGLAKQEVVTLLREKYRHYVPLKEIVDDEYAQSAVSNQTGGGYQVGRTVVRAFGRYTEAQADFILPGLIAQAKGTIAAGENADVLRAFLHQVEYAPNPDVWRVQKVIWKPYIDRDTGEVRYAPRPVQLDADYSARAISIPVNGERHIVVVDDQRLADAFKRSGLPVSGAVQVIGSITRFYATMATAANPEFVLTNLMRDFQQAMIRLTGEQNVELGAKVARDVLPAMWGAFRGLREKGQLTPDAGEWHTWYRRYIEAGGHVAYRGVQDPETQHKDFITKLAEVGIYPEDATKLEKMGMRGRRLMKATRAQHLTALVSDLNGAVENALRLAAFKNAIEAGWTEKDAAMLSRNLTVDFNLKGEAGTFINSLYMFFNANVQGNALLVRSIAAHPRIRGAVLMLIALGAMLDWWNRDYAEKDASGRSLYDDISEDVKQRNWVIMGPDRKNAILIPLPFGFNVFHTIGRHLVAVMPKSAGGADEKATKAAINTFGALFNAMSPFGNVPESWLGMAQLISPTFLDPIVQRITNRNWIDKTIFPERPRGATPQAASETYFPGTPEHYVAAAQWMNRASGGNEIRSGFVDPYPNVLQHWVNSVFGSSGATYSRILAYMGGKVIAGKEIETREIPFLRRFYYEPKDFELSHRFYDHVNEAEIAHLEVLRAMQKGRAGEAAMLREEYTWERKQYGAAHDAERRVAALRSEIAKVRAHPTMPAEKKKATIEKLQEQSRLAMQQFNAAFEQGR